MNQKMLAVFIMKLTELWMVVQELQSEVSSLEETKDDLLEHAEFVVSLLKPNSKEAAADTEKNVKELVEAYEKWVCVLWHV